MTKGLTFRDEFWDSDINGTYGWDTLCKRMKDGRKVCSEVTHYVRDRAKAEFEYSKALFTLTRKANGKEEIGILADSWQTLREQTDKIASAHEEAGQMFSRMQEELAHFNEEQKKSKQAIEDNVKKYIQSKKNDYSKAMSMKKNYDSKCMEHDNAAKTHDTVSKLVTAKPNEKLKAQTKLEKASDQRDNADLAYKSAIESLECSRRNWEKETEQAYENLEILEKQRIDILRNLLWKVTNVDSKACIEHDSCSENVRLVLERCDVMDEINTYIEQNKTGSKRPDPVLYENYYDKSGSARRPPQMRAPAPPPSVDHQRTLEDDHYAYVDGPQTIPSNVSSPIPSNLGLTVIKEYRAMKPGEIDVHLGDVLQRMDFGTYNGMYKVKLASSRPAKVGLVPAKCVTSSHSINIVQRI